jgi:hypothetical protein
MRLIPGLSAFILVMAVGAASASATTFTYTQATSNDWNTASNWSTSGGTPATPPTSSDDVVIGLGSPTLSTGANGAAKSITVSGGGSQLIVSGGRTLAVGAGASALGVSANGISVQGGASVTFAGAVTWTAGAIEFNNGGGTVDLLSGATLNLAADGLGALNFGGGLIHVSSGATLERTAAGTNGNLGVPVHNDGTVHVAAGTLMIGETLTQTAGLTTVEAGTELDGPAVLNGGTLNGTGTLGGPVTNNGGTVAPGASPGLLTINGNYTQSSGGTLQEEITGSALSAFDRLAVSGAVSLDGTLAILSGGFTPASTDTFKIISGAASRTGQFAALTGASFTGGSYTAQYDLDGATLTVAGAPPPPPPPPISTPTPTPTAAAPALSPDVAVAAATPACLSIPAVIRHQTAPVRGGGKVELLTNQVDDPARPLHASVRFAGRGAIKAVGFTANGRALTADARGFATAVPIGSLRIGRGRNRLAAKVTLRDGRTITVVQFFEVLRCPLPPVSCQRLADGHSLRCTGGTPLRARKVKVTVIHSTSQTARGTASVTRGRYTVTVRSSTALPAGRYAYKYVATTARRGQNFQVIRLVSVT